MASFRKRNNKWEARVRRQGNKAICKTFTNIEDAKRWAREQESKNYNI
jgi:predicted RNA-binding protein with PUA domain